MNNNEIEYDRDKDRQGLFDEEFFKQSYKNNLWFLEIGLEAVKNNPEDRPETLVDSLYLLTVTEYTAGHPIEAVYQRFEQAIEYSNLCLKIDCQFHSKTEPQLWSKIEPPYERCFIR